MTVPNDQIADIASRSQEAVTTAVHTWADTMQSFASKLGGGQSQLLDLQGAVAQYFEQTERATRSVAAHAATGTDTVVENAAETARVTAQKAAATARAANDATT